MSMEDFGYAYNSVMKQIELSGKSFTGFVRSLDAKHANAVNVKARKDMLQIEFAYVDVEIVNPSGNEIDRDFSVNSFEVSPHTTMTLSLIAAIQLQKQMEKILRDHVSKMPSEAREKLEAFLDSEIELLEHV